MTSLLDGGPNKCQTGCPTGADGGPDRSDGVPNGGLDGMPDGVPKGGPDRVPDGGPDEVPDGGQRGWRSEGLFNFKIKNDMFCIRVM
jgi:hypothetical protein